MYFIVVNIIFDIDGVLNIIGRGYLSGLGKVAGVVDSRGGFGGFYGGFGGVGSYVLYVVLVYGWY